uniref:NADH-ubiquinone oxidoreductase chain 2 n=1 Tax=Drieschia cf. elegans BG-2021 TaxID=2839741 RepID=A0A8E7IUQ5_9ANNE|nr:NADH dehydrogenase subunit 2 [Drieschia cf. elegans BG-2021]
MTFLPYITLFSLTLVFGTLLSLSGNQWIFIWMGLELNLMSFIPLLTFSSFNQESEAAMKYFLAQALGSGLILLSGLMIQSLPHMTFSHSIINTLLFLGLLIKLGLPPCHFWFPSVMSKISWPICILLSTWQKLIPILIIFYTSISSMNPFITWIILAASLIGGLGGMNQTQLRPLLAYSSIGHMSWMLAASVFSYSISIIYFLCYILISTPIMLMFMKFSSSLTSSMSSISTSNFIILPSIFMLLLSLAGIPPFIGFFPKWMVIQSISMFSPMLLIIILLGSVINLFYYLNLTFISWLKPMSPPFLGNNPKYGSMSFLSLVAISTLGLGPLVFTII